MAMKKTKKQKWHDNLVRMAINMGKDRHLGPRRALIQASFWLIRTADRIKEGRDPYTGEPK